MKFAHLNQEQVIGWYDPEIHSNIPTPNIEVSDSEWQICVDNNYNAYVNGEFCQKDFSTPAEKNESRVIELRGKLMQTDYKDLPSYDKRDTPEWQELMAQRQAWRDEIRLIEQSS